MTFLKHQSYFYTLCPPFLDSDAKQKFARWAWVTLFQI